MGPAESKLFSTPGSFNFSMAALAADPAALAGKNIKDSTNCFERLMSNLTMNELKNYFSIFSRIELALAISRRTRWISTR